MDAHYLAGETETDAGAICFGGEEGDKDFINDIFEDAGTIIGDLYSDASACIEESS